jgi:hypothetical protein
MASVNSHTVRVGFSVLVICISVSLITASRHAYATPDIMNAFGDNGMSCNGCHSNGGGTQLNAHGVGVATDIALANAALNPIEINFTAADQPGKRLNIVTVNNGPSRLVGPLNPTPASTFLTAVGISPSTLTASIDEFSGSGFTAGGTVTQLAGGSSSNNLFLQRNTKESISGIARITLTSNANPGGNLSGPLPPVVLATIDVPVRGQPLSESPPSPPTNIIIK